MRLRKYSATALSDRRVEFTVKAVAIGGSPFSMEEAVGRQPIMNADGKSSVSRLVVIVSENVEARLHQLGIEDLRTHFYKKTVRVAGDLKREVDAGGIGNRLITYSLTIHDLDQLEFVGSKAPQESYPARSGCGAARPRGGEPYFVKRDRFPEAPGGA